MANSLPPNAPVICLVGPTASGKTAAALALAAHFPIEIISLDSALVYRQMDIGTAKPNAAELAAVPHHLIDIIDPLDSYSAAQFTVDAQRLVKEIRARGRHPLIVGGTMLYYKAFAEGLNDLPQADAALRLELEAEAQALGWPALHARLAGLDAPTAARLHPTDSQRIGRALEIIRLTGRPMSELLAEQKSLPAQFATHVLALEPSNRSVLHARIAQRFDIMLEGGLLEEVETLRRRGDLHPDLPSMRCVGYRQTWAYLDGEYDKAALREKGIAATRQLAKRQLTWLRSIPERTVLDCLSPALSEQVLHQVRGWLVQAEG